MGSDEIWTPDIVLYNTQYSSRESHTDIYKSKAIVRNNGWVMWSMPVIWYASCEPDTTWFPLDQQKCTLIFGSLSYSIEKLKITPRGYNFSTKAKLNKENGEWKLLNISQTYGKIKFDCCPDAFSTLTYTVEVKRLSDFYFIYIIIPSVALCFLFLLVFFIPRNSGERMGFGITVLLSITVYLLVISGSLPEKSDVYPMLGVVFIAEFLMLCTALGLAGFNISIGGKSLTRPPTLVLRLLKIKDYNQMNVSAKKISAASNKELTEIISKENNKNNNSNVSLDNKDNYEKEWSEIADFLDWFFMISFFLLIIIIPIIIASQLDSKGL